MSKLDRTDIACIIIIIGLISSFIGIVVSDLFFIPQPPCWHLPPNPLTGQPNPICW
jgi:hypothetical protein